MAIDVTLGLDLIGGSPNLTFVFFVAFVLYVVLGLRFTFYAYRNGRAEDVATQDSLWWALVAVGLAAVGFAGLGVLDVVSSIQTPYRRAFLLLHVFLLVMVLWQISRTVVPTADVAPGTGRTRRRFAIAGLLAVGLAGVGIYLAPAAPLVLALEGLSALVFVLFGVSVGRRATTASRVRGTVLDSLLRHLLPVLLFASLVPVTGLAVLGGVEQVVVLHIQVVFVIMTATTLMTATIKLRQNLAGL